MTEDIIITEKTNPDTIDIDISTSYEIARMINNEDLKVAKKVSENLDSISKGIDLISTNILKGGRLIYFGAGTSGRLGVLDASECPPTFNTPPELVLGIIAGGDKALRYAIEGAEDSIIFAQKDFNKLNISDKDTVAVISASGNAVYVKEILKLAKEKNVKTIAVTCNPKAEILKMADISICVETGPEVISGSTRMKAGTAQKMVLNMLSTGAMVKIGKVYKNFMADVKPTNIKLKKRAVTIVSQISNCSYDTALDVLQKNGFKIKEAVIQILYSKSYRDASKILNDNNGILRNVFKNLK